MARGSRRGLWPTVGSGLSEVCLCWLWYRGNFAEHQTYVPIIYITYSQHEDHRLSWDRFFYRPRICVELSTLPAAYYNRTKLSWTAKFSNLSPVLWCNMHNQVTPVSIDTFTIIVIIVGSNKSDSKLCEVWQSDQREGYTRRENDSNRHDLRFVHLGVVFSC